MESPGHARSIERALAGKYAIVGMLGEGGSGVVYDAVRGADAAKVALKVMHPALAGDVQIRGRFQREATILGRLDGPNVCPILEHGEMPLGDDGTRVLYIAMPRLRGRSLEKVLKSDRRIAVDTALEIMLGICVGLETAHAQGIIHRDLKPANVMIDEGGSVFIVDFGMAKIITGAGAGTTNVTVHNMLFGTPEYMSPEQARGDDLDARCDVYAAGVILYEMLTGSPPFTGPTPLNVLTAHLTSQVEPPSNRAPERVTRGLERVVMRALAKDREGRYPSASALGAAIREARAETDAKPSDAAERGSAQGGIEEELASADAFAETLPAIEAFDGSAARPPEPPAGRTTDRPGLPPRDLALQAPTVPAAERVGDGGFWIALWIVAGLASVGVGVYLALR